MSSTTRIGIYARYSSDHQSQTSIEDQTRMCRARVEHDGGTVVQVYSDYAISGGSVHNRPGIQALMADVADGGFDTVIAEALDRISRDQEDIAAIYKRLQYAGVRLVTLAEGEISELHVGLKGTMNALYLKDLAQKTRRGLEGRVRQGRSGGGNAFGYDVVKETDERGEPVRGRRRINEDEAAVVRRIFDDFAAGHSPRAIARKLNDEGIPGPRGRRWQDSAIRGHAKRHTGILRNDLYIGRLVWNRQRFVKDPATGRRLAKPNPEDQWIVEDVPELRIVDDHLWQRAQMRLAGIRSSEPVAKARDTRFWEHRRAKHLLTGVLRCHACGGPMSTVGRDYVACSAAHRSGTCDNRKSVKRTRIEDVVLDCLKENLMRPELVEEFIRAFHEEVNRSRQTVEQGQAAKRRKLAEVERRIEGLYDAIADGLRTPGLKARLEEAEQRKATLERELEEVSPPAPVLHPNLSALYRRKVAELHAALSAPDTRTEAAEILRGLIEAVTVRATGRGAFELEITGEIVAMVELAQSTAPNKKTAPGGAAVPDAYHRSVKVVAGAGFEPATFRL